jgi:hypothetical protein
VLELTVPVVMISDESNASRRLPFMDTNVSTGIVDQVWLASVDEVSPRNSAHGKHRKKTQIKIFLISAPAMASV